jgi:hypothetical protein
VCIWQTPREWLRLTLIYFLPTPFFSIADRPGRAPIHCHLRQGSWALYSLETRKASGCNLPGTCNLEPGTLSYYIEAYAQHLNAVTSRLTR